MDTNSAQNGFNECIRHKLKNPTHTTDFHRNGFGYLVLCQDCGYHEALENLELARMEKKEHRRDHYGHEVEIKKKKWSSMGEDLTFYRRMKQQFPEAYHNLFAKRNIHQNFDSNDGIKEALKAKVMG